MSLLEQVHSGRRHRPPRLLIYGTEGIGKSTLAAQAPAPIFILTEDGLDQIECDSFPLARSFEDVLAYLTATPYRMKSGMLCGPDNLLNAICYEVGVKELIAQGFLCPLRTKAGRRKVDTSTLHIRAGEFIGSEVEELMDTDELVSAACREIIEMTRDRRAVLIFAASVAHAR